MIQVYPTDRQRERRPSWRSSRRWIVSASSQQASAVVNYNSSEVDGVMW